MRRLPTTPTLVLVLLGVAAPAQAQDDLPMGHPPLGTVTADDDPAQAALGQAPPGKDQMDAKLLLEKLDAMRDQLKERPKTAEIEFALGNLYYENRRYPEAIDYYRQLIERAAPALQRYLEARSHPHKDVQPEAAGCPAAKKIGFDELLSIADARATAHDYGAAVTCFEGALVPVLVARSRRANAFFLIGNPDRAVQEHRDVLVIEPDFPDSLFYLGAILSETADGDVAKLAEAGEAWQKYLASDPEPARAKLIKESLAKIEQTLAIGGHPPPKPMPPAGKAKHGR